MNKKNLTSLGTLPQTYVKINKKILTFYNSEGKRIKPAYWLQEKASRNGFKPLTEAEKKYREDFIKNL